MKKIKHIFLFLLITGQLLVAQDTIIHFSLERFISLKLSEVEESESKEFLITDSVNTFHVFRFSNGINSCSYSQFNTKGKLLISGRFEGDSNIEYYSIWSPNINTAILEEEKYYRIINRKNGEWKYYDAGNLIKKETYRNDKIIDVKEFTPTDRRMSK